METYWGSGGIAPRILNLGTRWRWVVSFTPRPLYPRERAPGTDWIGGWVGPRAVLDAVVKRKIPSSLRELNLRTPIVQPVAQHYTDWAITALNREYNYLKTKTAYERKCTNQRRANLYIFMLKSEHNRRRKCQVLTVKFSLTDTSLRTSHFLSDLG
jgi:hypothetical protein